MFFKKQKQIDELERRLKEEKKVNSVLVDRTYRFICKNKGKHEFIEYDSYVEGHQYWDTDEYTKYVCRICGKRKTQRRPY